MNNKIQLFNNLEEILKGLETEDVIKKLKDPNFSLETLEKLIKENKVILSPHYQAVFYIEYNFQYDQKAIEIGKIIE